MPKGKSVQSGHISSRKLKGVQRAAVREVQKLEQKRGRSPTASPEDVSQEVLLSSLAGNGRPTRKSVATVASRLIERRKRRGKPLSETPEGSVDRRRVHDLAVDMYAAIETLPDRQKAIMLGLLNSEKIKEIALRLRMSENAVQHQKKLAYARLRKLLKSHEYQDHFS